MSTSTINFTINGTNMTLEAAVANLIPGLLPARDITIELPVEQKHLNLLTQILKKIPIIPMRDIVSHKTTYVIVMLAKQWGIANETIAEGFIGWTTHDLWIDIWHPEYLYLIYRENEFLVDFNKFFRLHPDVFETAERAIALPELRADPQAYIEMLLFFKNYNINECFTQNNHKVQQRKDALVSARAAAWKLFLINPHEPFLKDYFVCIPSSAITWDCKDISVVAPYLVGETVLAPFGTAQERLRTFAFNMLDVPLNTSIKTPFPFENCVIAGGSISKILSAHFDLRYARQSDIDIFIYGATFDERARAFARVLEWFDTSNTAARTYYTLNGCVTTVYVKDIARKFQIITINQSNPFEVLDRFDMSYIQWCLVGGKTFFGTPEACKALRERVTHICCSLNLRAHRCVKALYNGYSMYVAPEIREKYVDITSLLVDPKSNAQLQQIIRELHKWYYPRTEPDMHPDDERAHILCMIESDSRATLVTDVPKLVLGNVTIGGNFENDYETTLFSSFNINNVVIGNMRRRGAVVVCTRRGKIRLTTPFQRVQSIRAVAEGLEIIVTVDNEAFANFCTMLETTVFRLFRTATVTKHIINEHRELKFLVRRYQLERQIRQGVSCLRSHRGQALNIEEDINSGNSIQVLFSITLEIYPDNRSVTLIPIKFIKYYAEEPAADNNEPDESREAADVDNPGEINYKEPTI